MSVVQLFEKPSTDVSTVATQLRALADRVEKGDYGVVTRVQYVMSIVVSPTNHKLTIGHTDNNSPSIYELVGELEHAQSVLLQQA